MIEALFLLLLISNTAAALLAMKREGKPGVGLTVWIVCNVAATLVYAVIVLEAWCLWIWPTFYHQILQ